MAVTITVVRRNVEGGRYGCDVDVTGPASYTSGGETLTAAQLYAVTTGLVSAWTGIQFFESENAEVNGRTVVLDKTNGKMMFFDAGAQTSGTTNLSAVTIRARFHYGQVTG